MIDGVNFPRNYGIDSLGVQYFTYEKNCCLVHLCLERLCESFFNNNNKSNNNIHDNINNSNNSHNTPVIVMIIIMIIMILLLLLLLLLIPLRENLKKLILTVNRQKDILKKNGVVVDGKRYIVDFKGTRETIRKK